MSNTTDPHAFIGKCFVGIHPDLFRSGKPARIVDIVAANGRPCFRLRWPDGVEDDTPIEDEDFAGKGGEGVFYNIVEEFPNV